MSSLPANNSSILGLFPVRDVAFSQVATTTWLPLSASFTPASLIVNVSNSNLPSFPKLSTSTFRITSASAQPAWIQVGVSVNLAFSVTVNAVSYNISRQYQIVTVDTVAGLYFDAVAPANDQLILALNGSALGATNADNVVTPLVSLSLQAQKFTFVANTGSVLLAPCVDINGNAPYTIALTNTTPPTEYDINELQSDKRDLANWSLKTTSSGTLAVRFR